MEKRHESTSKSFAILGVASIMVKLLAIIYIPFQRHVLGGDYGNGIAASGSNIFIFLYSLSNAGLPNAISKLVSEQSAKGNYKATYKILKCAYMVLLGLGILIGFLMCLGAHWIADEFLHQPKAYIMIIWLSPTLIFTSVSCALRGYFQGRRQMTSVAVSNVIEQLINSVLTVVFAAIFMRYGMEYGVAGTTIGTSMGALGAAAFMMFVFFGVWSQRRRGEIYNYNYHGPELTERMIYRTILFYSLPAILNTIASCAGSLIDSSQIKPILMADGFSEIKATSLFGVYSNQYSRFTTMAIAFSTALVTAMIPAISSANAVGDRKLMKHRITDSYKAIYAVTIPSIAGITFLAKPAISFLFIGMGVPGADLLVFGTWTEILFTIQSVQTGELIAIGRPVVSSLTMIAGMAVKLVLNRWLMAIPQINIKGAIIGSAVGWLIAIVLNQMALKRTLHFKTYYVRMMIKPAFCSLIMGVCCFGIYQILYLAICQLIRFHIVSHLVANDIAVVITVLCSIAIYFTLMIMTNGLNKGDILRLPMGTRIYRVLVRVPILRRKLVVTGGKA